MKKTFACAALILMGGYSAVQAGAPAGDKGYVQLAQMNSPGDGLDRNAAAEGNGRPRAYRGRRAKPFPIVQLRRKRAR